VDPQRMLEISEDRRVVRAALARLAPKPAAVLVLRAGGLSYAEVAQALGVGTGQIGTLLRRAEAALRKGGHPWLIYLKELCAGLSTIRTLSPARTGSTMPAAPTARPGTPGGG